MLRCAQLARRLAYIGDNLFDAFRYLGRQTVALLQNDRPVDVSRSLRDERNQFAIDLIDRDPQFLHGAAFIWRAAGGVGHWRLHLVQLDVYRRSQLAPCGRTSRGAAYPMFSTR